MTTDDLLDAYPAIHQAICYVELIICGDGLDQEILAEREPHERTCWDIMMNAVPPASLDEVVTLIRGAMAQETEGKIPQALEQTHHPQFLTYIRGKMGLL